MTNGDFRFSTHHTYPYNFISFARFHHLSREIVSVGRVHVNMRLANEIPFISHSRGFSILLSPLFSTFSLFWSALKKKCLGEVVVVKKQTQGETEKEREKERERERKRWKERTLKFKGPFQREGRRCSSCSPCSGRY